MNVERIKQLAEALRTRSYPGYFDMDVILERVGPSSLADKQYPGKNAGTCNTAGCIAGHTIMMFDDKPVYPITDCGWYGRTTYDAEDLLELDGDIATDLFFAGGAIEAVSEQTGMDYIHAGNAFMRAVTPEDAADVLDKLVETGEVDWTPVIDRVVAERNVQ